MGRRAESLAARVEEGADGLAAFAEGLSETEWRTPISRGGRDRRSVGVIVHHVASVYPIEIDLARTIASGKAVTGVTWEVVDEMNAKLASDALRWVADVRPGAAPNKRLKPTAPVDCGMNLSSARRSLSAIR